MKNITMIFIWRWLESWRTIIIIIVTYQKVFQFFWTLLLKSSFYHTYLQAVYWGLSWISTWGNTVRPITRYSVEKNVLNIFILKICIKLFWNFIWNKKWLTLLRSYFNIWFINFGSSISSMYQPKLLQKWAIRIAINGIDVKILSHGISDSFYEKKKKKFVLVK